MAENFDSTRVGDTFQIPELVSSNPVYAPEWIVLRAAPAGYRGWFLVPADPCDLLGSTDARVPETELVARLAFGTWCPVELFYSERPVRRLDNGALASLQRAHHSLIAETEVAQVGAFADEEDPDYDELVADVAKVVGRLDILVDALLAAIVVETRRAGSNQRGSAEWTARNAAGRRVRPGDPVSFALNGGEADERVALIHVLVGPSERSPRVLDAKLRPGGRLVGTAGREPGVHLLTALRMERELPRELPQSGSVDELIEALRVACGGVERWWHVRYVVDDD